MLGINTYYTGKLIHVGFLVQMKDIAPTLVLSLSMCALVFGVISFLSTDILKLIVGFTIGACFFLTVALSVRMKEITFIKEIVRKK